MDKKLIIKLYDYLDLNIDKDNIKNDITVGYLTENKGRDENNYLYYFDGVLEGAINTKTQEIITDEEKLSILFE